MNLWRRRCAALRRSAKMSFQSHWVQESRPFHWVLRSHLTQTRFICKSCDLLSCKLLVVVLFHCLILHAHLLDLSCLRMFDFPEALQQFKFCYLVLLERCLVFCDEYSSLSHSIRAKFNFHLVYVRLAFHFCLNLTISVAI